MRLRSVDFSMYVRAVPLLLRHPTVFVMPLLVRRFAAKREPDPALGN